MAMDVIHFQPGPAPRNAKPTASLPAVPMATVRVHADALDPAVVTALLGPAEVAAPKGGVLRRTRGGHEVQAKTGTWFVSTPSHVQSSDPAKHLRWAVDRVAVRVDDLFRLVPGLKVEFSLMVSGAEDDARAVLARSGQALDAQLARARGLGTVLLEIPSSGFAEVLGRNLP